MNLSQETTGLLLVSVGVVIVVFAFLLQKFPKRKRP